MKIHTLVYFVFEGIKKIKRNFITTIFSVVTIAISLFVVGIFQLYFTTMNNNTKELFSQNIKLLKSLNIFGFIGLAIISPILIILILNSFKIATHVMNRDLFIMRSIGATNWFIVIPFIVQGIIIGAIGGYIGCLSIFYFYKFVYVYSIKFFPHLIFTSPELLMKMLLWKFIILGMIVAPIANIITIRKSLNKE